MQNDGGKTLSSIPSYIKRSVKTSTNHAKLDPLNASPEA